MKSPRLLLLDVQKVGTVMQYLYIAIKITIKQCFLYSSSVNNIAKWIKLRGHQFLNFIILNTNPPANRRLFSGQKPNFVPWNRNLITVYSNSILHILSTRELITASLWFFRFFHFQCETSLVSLIVMNINLLVCFPKTRAGHSIPYITPPFS